MLSQERQRGVLRARNAQFPAGRSAGRGNSDSAYAMFLSTNSELGDSRLAVILHCRDLGLCLSQQLGCDAMHTADLSQSPPRATDCCWCHGDQCDKTRYVLCFHHQEEPGISGCICLHKKPFLSILYLYTDTDQLILFRALSWCLHDCDVIYQTDHPHSGDLREGPALSGSHSRHKPCSCPSSGARQQHKAALWCSPVWVFTNLLTEPRWKYLSALGMGTQWEDKWLGMSSAAGC